MLHHPDYFAIFVRLCWIFSVILNRISHQFRYGQGHEHHQRHQVRRHKRFRNEGRNEREDYHGDDRDEERNNEYAYPGVEVERYGLDEVDDSLSFWSPVVGFHQLPAENTPG